MPEPPSLPEALYILRQAGYLSLVVAEALLVIMRHQLANHAVGRSVPLEEEDHVQSSVDRSDGPTDRPSAAPAECADRLRELLMDLRELEAIYNRDKIAQPLANQIERIFDTWLYDEPAARLVHGEKDQPS